MSPAARIRIGVVAALGIAVVASAFAFSAGVFRPSARAPWTADEIELLRSLWIGSLSPLPPDPSDRVADDPRAATLGQRLFFDVRLSGNHQVAWLDSHHLDARVCLLRASYSREDSLLETLGLPSLCPS